MIHSFSEVSVRDTLENRYAASRKGRHVPVFRTGCALLMPIRAVMPAHRYPPGSICMRRAGQPNPPDLRLGMSVDRRRPAIHLE